MIDNQGANGDSAGPVLRRHIIDAAQSMEGATTQRDRRHYGGQLYGFVKSLDVLLASREGKHLEPGIHGLTSLQWPYIDAARKFIGDEHKADMLGIIRPR